MDKSEQAANAKPVAKLMEAVMDVVERDVKLGLYEPEALRLTVEARKKAAIELSANGMSHRQIAKVTGASRATIDRDLGGSNEPKNGSNEPPENDPSLPDQSTVRARYQRSLLSDALTAVDEMTKRTRAKFFQQLREKYNGIVA